MLDPGELLQLTNAQLRETVGTTVRELDACLGLPPFPNPSSPQCVSLARGLVNLLAHVNQKGHISTLGGLEEVKMTLPVLCASLRGGSLEQRPCPILMELLIEALCYVHGLSCYPLQSLLDDVKAIIPQSPIALKFFALTGALDVETLCFFLGIPQSRCCKDKKQRRSRNANGKACKITQGSDVSELSLKEPTGDLSVVPSSAMIKTALDVVLPEECMKLLLSLLNNSPSFQRVVGVDTVMATKILDVYGDHLIPCLHPVALISCLDVTLMDVFIDTVQLHGEKMTLFTEPAFTQRSIASWTADRLGHLVRYCVTRNIQPRDAFGSVVTYVYMYKVLTEWESCGKTPTNVTVDEEAGLWRASVKAALLVRSSAPEVDRFVRPLCALVHYIRERHTNELLHGIHISQSHVPSSENVGALVKEISTILEDVRHSVAGARDTNNKSRRKKCKTKPSMNETAFSSASVCELYTQCKQAVDLLSLVAWLTTSEDEVVQNATWQQLELAAELILSAENGGSSGHVPIPAAALESFQHAFISLMYMHRKPGRGAVEGATQDTTVPFGKKCLAALVSAAHVTHRLDCFCHLVRRFPCTLSFLSQSLELYNVILFVWVNDAPPLHKFYEGPLPTPTHTVGLLLSLLCEERTDHLVQEIVDNDAIVAKLVPALQKLNGEGNVIDEAARSGFLTLQRCLQRTLELRRKALKEEMQRCEEAKQIEVLQRIKQREELLKKAAEFEAELRACDELRRSEQARVEAIREFREKEKEERFAKERSEALDKKKKVVEALNVEAQRRKVAQLAEQKERLQSYQMRSGAMCQAVSFLESLHIGSTQILNIINTLGSRLSIMTREQVLEFIVDGNTEVPRDMRALKEDSAVSHRGEIKNQALEREPGGSEEKECIINNEEPSFWDNVMRALEQRRRNGVNNTEGSCNDGVSNTNATVDTSHLANGDNLSFHKQVNSVLNLFDYSVKEGQILPDALPSIDVRAAVRLLTPENFLQTPFANAHEALLECQKRALCTLRNGKCKLTPLGFHYHLPFHDPEAALGFQLEQRRRRVREMQAVGRFLEEDSPPCRTWEVNEEELVESGAESGESYCEGVDLVTFSDEVL